MTNDKYWIFLERLRRTGTVNMYGAVPYLVNQFGISEVYARGVLLNWMKHYNPDDYKELDDEEE